MIKTRQLTSTLHGNRSGKGKHVAYLLSKTASGLVTTTSPYLKRDIRQLAKQLQVSPERKFPNFETFAFTVLLVASDQQGFWKV